MSGFLPAAIFMTAVMALLLIPDSGCFIVAGPTAASKLGAATAALAPSAAQMRPHKWHCTGPFSSHILGLLVSAWLQWKKGPALGIESLSIATVLAHFLSGIHQHQL